MQNRNDALFWGGIGVVEEGAQKNFAKKKLTKGSIPKNGNLQLGVGPPPLLRSEEFIGGRLDVFGVLFIIFLSESQKAKTFRIARFL